MVGRWLGWILIGAALGVLSLDLYAWYHAAGGAFVPMKASQAWMKLDMGSLDRFRDWVAKSPYPQLWNRIIDPALHVPAILLPAVPGLLLVIIFRLPKPTGVWRKRRRR